MFLRIGRRASCVVACPKAYRLKAGSIYGPAGRGGRFFEERFVANNEIASFFPATDGILLTYKSEFVSQSGVLHLAANWDKPVLASAGAGPLTESVARHNLGIVVKPDSAEGLSRLVSGRYPALGWAGFREAASWKVNIDSFLDALAGNAAPAREAVSGRALYRFD